MAAKHIVEVIRKPMILYAGNSDGDYELMKQILINKFNAPHSTFGIFVQPNLHDKGQLLTNLFKHHCQRGQCIELK